MQTLFADYGGLGEGITFLIVVSAIAAAVLGWTTFWLLQGFRSRVPTSSNGRRALWTVTLLVALAVACFPPQRRAGDWREVSANEPVATSAADSLDQAYFGIIPRFAWFGMVGSEELMFIGVIYRLPDMAVAAHCSRFCWKVAWGYVAVEVACAILLVLPFARARRLN